MDIAWRRGRVLIQCLRWRVEELVLVDMLIGNAGWKPAVPGGLHTPQSLC